MSTDHVPGRQHLPLPDRPHVGITTSAEVRLYVDGRLTGQGSLDRATPLVYSYDETTDIGEDGGSTVSDEYDAAVSLFDGSVNWVQIDVGENDDDHLISPEERRRVSMARQ